MGYYSRMNTLFEKLVHALASTPIVLLSILWCAYAFYTGSRDFIDVISMVTFIVGELILRGQQIEQQRMEDNLKKDLRATKRIEKKLE